MLYPMPEKLIAREVISNYEYNGKEYYLVLFYSPEGVIYSSASFQIDVDLETEDEEAEVGCGMPTKNKDKAIMSAIRDLQSSYH